MKYKHYSKNISGLTFYFVTLKDFLDKTLKGIRGVRLGNRKVFRALCRRTKYFKRLFLSFNKLYSRDSFCKTT